MGSNCREKIKNILFIGVRIGPISQEAGANHARELRRIFKANIFTANNISGYLFESITDENMIILNGKYINLKYPILYHLNGLIFVTIARYYSKKFRVIYLIEGINSRWFRYMPLNKCIHPVTSRLNHFSKTDIDRYVYEIAPKLGAIIAQTPSIKAQLLSFGIDSNKIHVIYPSICLNHFNYKPVPQSEKFKLLFASSPTVKDQQYNHFEGKGVPLLLEAFKDFSKNIESKLYLIWRNEYLNELKRMIKELEIEDDVIIINNFVEMSQMYSDIHVTIIPYENMHSSPDIPSSAIESLACGRPVITTTIPEIYEIIEKEKCGTVAQPTKNEFVRAMINCYNNYDMYQGKCRAVAEKYFDINKEVLKLETIHKNLK